jgi:hypothetical protein
MLLAAEVTQQGSAHMSMESTISVCPDQVLLPIQPPAASCKLASSYTQLLDLLRFNLPCGSVRLAHATSVVWAGYCAGRECAGCDLAILQHEVAY